MLALGMAPSNSALAAPYPCQTFRAPPAVLQSPCMQQPAANSDVAQQRLTSAVCGLGQRPRARGRSGVDTGPIEELRGVPQDDSILHPSDDRWAGRSA